MHDAVPGLQTLQNHKTGDFSKKSLKTCRLSKNLEILAEHFFQRTHQICLFHLCFLCLLQIKISLINSFDCIIKTQQKLKNVSRQFKPIQIYRLSKIATTTMQLLIFHGKILMFCMFLALVLISFNSFTNTARCISNYASI